VTEIQWWHAMTGPNNDVVVKLANDFNASQSDYKVVPTFKGSYADTLNAGIAAFRAGKCAGHHAGVRGRNRDHDGGQGRHQAGLPADEGSGASRSIPKPICRRSPDITRPRKARCCHSRSIRPAW